MEVSGLYTNLSDCPILGRSSPQQRSRQGLAAAGRMTWPSHYPPLLRYSGREGHSKAGGSHPREEAEARWCWCQALRLWNPDGAYCQLRHSLHITARGLWGSVWISEEMAQSKSCSSERLTPRLIPRLSHFPPWWALCPPCYYLLGTCQSSPVKSYRVGTMFQTSGGPLQEPAAEWTEDM